MFYTVLISHIIVVNEANIEKCTSINLLHSA